MSVSIRITAKDVYFFIKVISLVSIVIKFNKFIRTRCNNVNPALNVIGSC